MRYGPTLDVDRIRSDTASLARRYDAVDRPYSRLGFWQPDKVAEGVDVASFRGDNMYVWQGGDPRAEVRRLIAYARYVSSIDRNGLLARMREDGAFGAVVAPVPGMGLVSRDLLDSVVEIYAIDRYARILERDDVAVADIGAGYGRLGHRMIEAGVGLRRYLCLDGVPLSTVLCAFYLDHRGVAPLARAVSLVDEEFLEPPTIDLALAVHSIPEMPSAAVAAWLERLADTGVEQVVVVPNDPYRLHSTEADGSRPDIAPLFAAHGYKIVANDPLVDDADPWFGPTYRSRVPERSGAPDRIVVFERRRRGRIVG